MKSCKKKLLICSLAFVLLVSFSMFFVGSGLFARANTANPDLKVIGASVRIVDSDGDAKTVDGLKFHVQVKTSVLNTVREQSNAKIVALLCPTHVLKDNALVSGANSSVVEVVLYEKQNNEVVKNGFVANNIVGDYTETTCGISTFPSNDFSRELDITCRAYYQIGNNAKVYSENCTRSLEQVAATAYNDEIFDPVEEVEEIEALKAYLVNYYQINFDTNGGEALSSKVALSGEQTIDFLKTVPTREGYDFIRWEKQSIINLDAPTAEYPIRNVLNLKAIWRQSSIADSTYDLISNGASAYSIYTASNDDKVIFAANEMQSIIKKATGVTLPITETATAPYISLGVDKTKVSVTGDNGYDISLDASGNVIISGADEVGAVFGAYKFLNLQFNYVYYAKDTVGVDTGVANEKLLVFSDYEYSPALPNVYGLGVAEGEDSLRFLNSNSSAVKPLYYGHSHLYWLPKSEYEAAHPDWYTTSDDGKEVAICLTNEALIAEMANVIGVKLSETEETINVMLSAFDHMTICECENCKKSDAEYTHAGTDILFANAVAEALEGLGYDNFRLVTLAYYGTANPPIDKYTGKALVKAHEKVVPYLCFVYSDASGNIEEVTEYGTGFGEDPMALIDGWSKVSDNLNCWIYQGYLDKLKLMFVDELPYLQNWLLAIERAGVKNSVDFVEIENASVSIFKELNIFCQTQLAYDTTADTNALIASFMANYYGVAGDKMLEVYNSLITRINDYETSTGKNTVNVSWGGNQQGQKYEKALWTEAYLNEFLSLCGQAYTAINNSNLSQAEKTALINKVAEVEMFGRYWKLKYYDTTNYTAQAHFMIDATNCGYDTENYVMFDNMDAVNAVAIEISTAEQFVRAMKYGKGTYVLTADIDLSNVIWHTTYVFNVDFSGTLDGQGHKIYGLTKQYQDVHEVYGIFNTISGTIKNAYIRIEDCAVIGTNEPGKEKGFLAATFTGTMQDCIVDYKFTIGSGSSYITTTGMFYTVENGTLKNIVLINRSSTNSGTDVENFNPLITTNATNMVAENIALIRMGSVPYANSWGLNGLGTNFLSTSVNKGIKNVYVYASMADAISGSAAYALNNDIYQGLADGAAANSVDYWTSGVTMSLATLLADSKNIKVEAGQVFLNGVLVIDGTVRIATADEFVSAMTTDPTGNYILTADIDMSEYLATNPWHTTYILNVDFSGTLDGQGHKIYGLTKTFYGGYEERGVFRAISGTIKNTYIKIENCVVIGDKTAGKEKGFLASTFTGTIENCIIDYKLSIGGGTSYITTTGMFYTVENGTLKNIVIIDRNDTYDSSFANSEPLITANATNMVAENIALISTGGVDARELSANFLSTTVNDFNNVYLYNSIENAINGSAAYALNDTYGNNAVANSADYWTKNATMSLATLLANSNFTFKSDEVYLDGAFAFDTAVRIATADEFVSAMTTDPTGNYILTADIDMSEYLATNPWHTTYILNVDFSGTLDGQGHKIYGLTKTFYGGYEERGVFRAISGTIKNTYIKIENCVVIGDKTAGKEKGFLASTFTGTIENCIIDYKLSIGDGTSYITTTGMFYTVENGTLKNIVIIDRNDESYANFEPLIAANATNMVAENIALICTGGVQYAEGWGLNGLGTNFLSTTVNKGIKNVYVYNSITDAINGTVAYALDNETYQTLTEGDTATANSASYWKPGVTMSLATLLANSNFTFKSDEVYLDGAFAFDTAVRIATADEFVSAITADPTGKYVLTADIDMSEYLATNPWHTTYILNVDFSGTLDGQGHKIYGLTKQYQDVHEVYGIFKTISGTIKNAYIKIEDCAVIGTDEPGKEKGFLASTFTGTMQDCVIDYKLSIGNGSSYIKTTSLFHIVNGGVLKNIVIIDRTDVSSVANFEPLIAANATNMVAENIALICTSGVPYAEGFGLNGLGTNFLSTTVNKGIKNVYVYNSIADAINGTVAYALDNETYQTLTEGDTATANSPSYWKTGVTKAIADLQSANELISVSNGQLTFNGVTIE